MTFDSSAGAPQTAIITLSPGVLASLAANPSCLQSVQHSPACMIGSGSATLMSLIPVPLTAYLVPATNPNDAAGIDFVSSASTSTAEVQLKQDASGAISSVLNVDLSTLGAVGNHHRDLADRQWDAGRPTVQPHAEQLLARSFLADRYLCKRRVQTSSASPDFTITGCRASPTSRV